MSSITLIGTGNMARAIGALAVAGGNTVEVVGRDQSKADDLAKTLGGGATAGTWKAVPAGDIVITALLYDGVVPVVTEYGDALAGKVVVDMSSVERQSLAEYTQDRGNNVSLSVRPAAVLSVR